MFNRAKMNPGRPSDSLPDEREKEVEEDGTLGVRCWKEYGDSVLRT